MTAPVVALDRLHDLREDIDAIDRRLVSLLAQRMQVVDQVIARKREAGLPALIPSRVEDVVAKVRAEADRVGLAPDLGETVWRALMAWVIDYEARHLA
ncbi:MAG: chorismate mutase [Bauldia sp.]